ncbi:hypothetical protein AN217_17290 [Streptomyces qinglanensis]|uniref:Uncharacterized protein n=1 Tax=Streptomyces qinglanensis TaxID=943816 RepID=A0A1E7K5T4_9ACTN|nr:DUF6284 family protein [Streptomyces qinglanensis]OEU99274.1 hypothetical protein AN217_17290 [Streptomyces qinglanensis]OEV28356.1 hypothetical protein AN220_01860 [Streptomyces nanshensis]
MEHIVTVQEAVTAFVPWREPTAGELDAIELEMPAITADLDWLEAVIITLDRTPTELDTRRVRRERRRALDARRDLANRTAESFAGGAA